ncbi:MAG: hypothetical protein M0R77_00400 [Gammaproteobacteria bacterium]|nr:hypothetical protein [Acholeplasmataceae bacterium]MCK9529014.1 hypothetical protein [Gammaproteobacteria bacterium]
MKPTNKIFGINQSETPALGLNKAIDQLKDKFDHAQLRGSESLGKAVFSSEGLDPTSSVATEARDLYQNVQVSLESVFKDTFGMVEDASGRSVAAVTISEAGQRAAAAAAIMATNVPAYLQSAPHVSRGSMESIPLITGTNLSYTTSKRQFSAEAYDTRELRDTTVYSIIYNQKHGNQDEFAESFFPTVTVSPDQAGYTVTMNVMTVMNEVRRDISGDETDFGRKNLIHAVIDPTILDNDQTRLVPVYRPEAAANFVDPALVPLASFDVAGEAVPTTSLLFDNRIDILGISQTEALLETGIMDSTDAVDSSLFLDNVVMKVTDGADDEVIRLSTRHMHESNFYPVVQGNFRQLRLMFDTKDVLVGGSSGAIKTVRGADSVLLAPIVTSELAVRLSFVVSGQINVETGLISLQRTRPIVSVIRDEQGNKIATDDPRYQTVVDLFEDAELIGYTLDGYRTNSNRRQRGQLVDTTYQSQMYQPQLRSPITIPRPETNVSQTDSIDIAALLVATGIRTTNAAIDEIFKTQTVLAQHFNANDPVSATPTLMGVALGPIRPFYETDVIDVEAEINSLKSHEKVQDMQAVLLNRIRDVAYRAWRDSGYKPVADALAGGISKKPTVLIGTDPVIANYLITPGDVRTLGAEMDFKIVSTFNQRVKGQIFITFINPDSAKSGVPDPLTFGNMGWKPELVIALPTYFNGANSRQITVQPCFIHSINCPILAHFTVVNLDKVTRVRNPIAFEEVQP